MTDFGSFEPPVKFGAGLMIIMRYVADGAL